MAYWVAITIVYLAVGFAAAGFTFAVFPPHGGYEPPRSVVLLAVFTYVAIWPFLLMIAVGYLLGLFLTPLPDRPVSSARLRSGNSKRFVYRSLYEETPN